MYRQVHNKKGVFIGVVSKVGNSMKPPRGRPGTKAVPGVNGIQLKERNLEMSIRDFLAVRTAGLENGLPREGREALSGHWRRDRAKQEGAH